MFIVPQNFHKLLEKAVSSRGAFRTSHKNDLSAPNTTLLKECASQNVPQFHLNLHTIDFLCTEWSGLRSDWFISRPLRCRRLNFSTAALVWLSVGRPLIRKYIHRPGLILELYNSSWLPMVWLIRRLCNRSVVLWLTLLCFNRRWRLFKHPRLGQSTGAVTQERQPPPRVPHSNHGSALIWSLKHPQRASFLHVSSFCEKNSRKAC